MSTTMLTIKPSMSTAITSTGRAQKILMNRHMRMVDMKLPLTHLMNNQRVNTGNMNTAPSAPGTSELKQGGLAGRKPNRRN
jgi:hypothetical protein